MSHIPQRVLEAWAKTCRNGCGMCGDRPCDACCAGGICDRSRCTCDDEREGDDLDDDGACEGYGVVGR